jgi:hypothetical protein
MGAKDYAAQVCIFLQELLKLHTIDPRRGPLGFKEIS